ncbi:RHS Repeat family protein, partial [bacterium]|nr:RHS Repeat family protein [bacterium]
MTEVSYPSGRADEFEYDENGNRTEWSSDSAPTTTYTYN